MKYLSIICFLVLHLQVSAKKGPIHISSKSGNVETLIIIDEINSAEVEKMALIGQLCNSYLQNSEFENLPVFIFYLNAPCLDKKNESVFLSFDRGQTNFYIPDKNKVNRAKLQKGNGLVIRIITSDIDARRILEILEFGLQNKDVIKKNQREVNFNYWKWKSIDNVLLKSVMESFHFSSKIDFVLNYDFRINSNLSNIKCDWECGEFSFYYKQLDNPILKILNIYQIINISATDMVIFDTNYSFYYLDLKSDHVFNKQMIEKKSDCEKVTAIINDSCLFMASKDDIITRKVIFYNPYENIIINDTLPPQSILDSLYNSLLKINRKEVNVEIIKR